MKGLNKLDSLDFEGKMKTLEDISCKEKIDELYFQRMQIFKAIQHYRFSYKSSKHYSSIKEKYFLNIFLLPQSIFSDKSKRKKIVIGNFLSRKQLKYPRNTLIEL